MMTDFSFMGIIPLNVHHYNSCCTSAFNSLSETCEASKSKCLNPLLGVHVYSCVQNNSGVLKKRVKLKILIITFTSIHTNALGTLHIQ